MAGLIRDLGSDDWQSRESATEALAAFGFLARPLLDEALKSSPDPEVRRRVEQLIGEME
jgi:HEAT repeat protein